MTANVPMIEIGTATPGMTVAHTLRRNRKITITTRQTVIMSVKRTSATEARMVSVRSERRSILIVAGIDARSVPMSFLILSTVSTVLALVARWMNSSSAG